MPTPGDEETISALEGLSANDIEQTKVRSALRLRHPFLPPKRLSKRVLIGAGLILGAVLAVVLTLTFKHGGPRPAKQGVEVNSTKPQAPPDAVTALAKTYEDIPQLGPPKFDMGAQGSDGVNGIASGPVPHDPNEASSLPAISKRHEISPGGRDLDLGRNSQIFANSASGRSDKAAQGLPDGPKTPDRSDLGNFNGLGLSLGHDLVTQGEPKLVKAALGANGVNSPIELAPSQTRLSAKPSPYSLQAGALIPAALLTGIQSDLPGLVVAQVLNDVYDSILGQHRLIPQGSKLIGHYENVLGAGQTRLGIVWERLIFPDGRSLSLDATTSVDNLGQAGVRGKANFHWMEKFKAATLSSLLSVGAELAVDEADETSLRALRDGTQSTLNTAGQKVLERQLNVPATLTLKPGSTFKVLVAQDLVIEAGF